jgi:uncharacterized MAPEG superfamily protein
MSGMPLVASPLADIAVLAALVVVVYIIGGMREAVATGVIIIILFSIVYSSLWLMGRPRRIKNA